MGLVERLALLRRDVGAGARFSGAPSSIQASTLSQTCWSTGATFSRSSSGASFAQVQLNGNCSIA